MRSGKDVENGAPETVRRTSPLWYGFRANLAIAGKGYCGTLETPVKEAVSGRTEPNSDVTRRDVGVPARIYNIGINRPGTT